MTRPMVRVHDLATNEVIDREMNDDEYSQLQAEQAALATLDAEKQAEAEAKAAQRQALLSRLGITEEEARILLGGN